VERGKQGRLRHGEDRPIVTEGTPHRDPAVDEFVANLSPEERTLLVIRDELYAGLWDEMLKDLEARLHAKPYVFKLASRIEDDIVRIRKMRDFEQEHDVNLRDLLSDGG
jgi:hypothetical protein